MSDDRGNEGIIISGGTVQVGAMAAGRNARAVNNVESASAALATRGQAELAEKLDELLQVIRKHEAELPDRDEALELTGRVAEELEREQPDKPTVESFLARLAASAGSATTIVNAVTTLSHAVIALI
jgi:hypothetical protein